MKNILLFAGTTEGRLLTEYLIKRQVKLHVCVATEYGKNLLPTTQNLTVSANRLNEDEMIAFIKESGFDLVLDATHPYATEVTRAIVNACHQTNTAYQRIVRDTANNTECNDLDVPAFSEKSSDISANTLHYLDDIEAAVNQLSAIDNPIFLTTGSKNLPEFMKIPDAVNRVFVRILPNPDMLKICYDLGMKPSHIFCVQGPFDMDMNQATIHHIEKVWEKENPGEASLPLYMVTKQSGKIGGFDEKIEAAKKANIPSIIIGRPSDMDGLSLSEAYIWLENFIGDDNHLSTVCQPIKHVYLIGTGMSSNQLTLEADDVLKNCDVIIGAKRMIEMASHYHKPTYCSYDYSAITHYMLDSTAANFAVLFSGDIGFFSGASVLRRHLKDLPFKIHAMSGISAPIHFLNQIGQSWSDVKLLSLHGKQISLINHVCQYKKTLFLLGKTSDVKNICQTLIDYHLSDVLVTVGSALQQDDEEIVIGRPKDFINREFSALSMIYIENTHAQNRTLQTGLSDARFVRGKVPMTKSEVRAVVLSKLALTENAVVYDIGAGTGSVAIEIARHLTDGDVYAIEKNPEGLSLIQENAIGLQVDNLHIVDGIAPDCMGELPAATHAFIGGSSGHLKEILTLLYDKNPNIHIVITAITLETITEIMQLTKQMHLPEPEIVQVSVSTTKKAGPYHLMQGQNPVFIISL